MTRLHEMETVGSLCSKHGWSLGCCRLFLQSESYLLLFREQIRKQRVKAQNLSRLSLHDPVWYGDSTFRMGTAWHAQSAWSEECGQAILLGRIRKLLMSPDLSLPSVPPPTDSGSIYWVQPTCSSYGSKHDRHTSFFLGTYMLMGRTITRTHVS